MDSEYNRYDDEIINISEVSGTDLKINPDYYIHTALLKSQAALLKDDIKSGFLQYSIFIDHIEVLCKSAKMVKGDFDEKVKQYKQSDDYKKIDKELIKNVKLATYKLKLIMSEVFDNKVITEPLKG